MQNACIFKISIPRPCHEDWNAMTPNEQGRHCKACATTVVDFTAMTDEADSIKTKNPPKADSVNCDTQKFY